MDVLENSGRNLLTLVSDFVELRPQRSRFIEVERSSRIERDLGIDSLARTELILRIEGRRAGLSRSRNPPSQRSHELRIAIRSSRANSH